MSTSLSFPAAETIEKFLLKHDQLADEYYSKKGISSIVARIAGERFSQKNFAPIMVKLGAVMIVSDLQTGKIEIDGKKLSKSHLSDERWVSLTPAIEKALTDCANRVSRL